MARIRRIRIDRVKLRASVRDLTIQEIRKRLGPIGATLLSQTQRRFDDKGDEEIRWPGLWINNPSAVAKFTNTRQARKKRASRTKRAQSALDRLDAGQEGFHAKRGQARQKLRDASKAEEQGVPDLFRRGGEPLRDTDELLGSFDFVVQSTPKGGIVRIGSPLPRALFHQNGFTTSGPNYIPLTSRARMGWNPKLIRGHDFIMMGKGVTVPARPMVRLTQQNRKDIIRIVEGR